MSAFTAASIGAWLVVVTNALVVRGRLFAAFAAVMVGMYTLAATALVSLVRPTPVWPVYLGLHAVVYVHLLLLARPAMRPLIYRVLVSLPASFFIAGTLLALPWGIAGGL